MKTNVTPEVLAAVLHHHAGQRPDAVFARFPGEQDWTFGQALTAAQAAAAGLLALGVQRGDRVVCWLPNGKDFLRAWFGANYLGAVHTPLNLSWRGRMLENAMALSGARVAIVHADLLSRLAEVACPGLEQLVIVGDAGGFRDDRFTIHDAGVLETARPAALPDPPLEAWDDMMLLFTSGTTGPSKGVLSSYALMAHFLAEGLPETFGAEETHLVLVPLFHAGGASAVYAQLRAGGPIVLPTRFQTDAFWSTVNAHRVTTTILLGVMPPFLLSAPPSAADRDHSLKTVSISPLGPDALAFGERFGVRVWTAYGASEMGTVLSCVGDTETLGAAGRLRKGYEARLVDEHDIEVPPGAIGEFVIRADQPWRLFTSYLDDPQATLGAMRNGWYHSGDLMRRSENGLHYFMDRRKDAIRRRGENISSQEVEADVAQYGPIRDVAAYAAPATQSEDEVMVAVTTDGDLDWAALVAFLANRMPHYMVPRYFRRMASLPRTETGKVRKELLREEGVTVDTWDREAAGLILKGTRLK